MFWLVPLWLLVVFGSPIIGAIGFSLIKLSKLKTTTETFGQVASVTAALLGGLVLFGCFVVVGGTAVERLSNPVAWLNLAGLGSGIAGIIVCGLKEDRRN